MTYLFLNNIAHQVMSPEVDEMSLLLLADELIDMVFSYSFIDHKDLCRCAQVCRRLNVVATGNELWKKKALSRYSSFIQEVQYPLQTYRLATFDKLINNFGDEHISSNSLQLSLS